MARAWLDWLPSSKLQLKGHDFLYVFLPVPRNEEHDILESKAHNWLPFHKIYDNRNGFRLHLLQQREPRAD